MYNVIIYCYCFTGESAGKTHSDFHWKDSLAYFSTQCGDMFGKDIYKHTHTPKHMNTQNAHRPGVGEKNEPDIGTDHRPR